MVSDEPFCRQSILKQLKPELEEARDQGWEIALEHSDTGALTASRERATACVMITSIWARRMRSEK